MKKESDDTIGLVQGYLPFPNIMERFPVKLTSKEDLEEGEKKLLETVFPSYEIHLMRGLKHLHPHAEEICAGVVKVLPKVNAYLQRCGATPFKNDDLISSLTKEDVVIHEDFLLTLGVSLHESPRILITYRALPPGCPAKERARIKKFLTDKVEGTDFSLRNADLLKEYLVITTECLLCDLNPGNLKMDAAKRKLFLFDWEPIYPDSDLFFSDRELKSFTKFSSVNGLWVAVGMLGLESLDTNKSNLKKVVVKIKQEFLKSSKEFTSLKDKTLLRTYVRTFNAYKNTLQKINKESVVKEKRAHERKINRFAWTCRMLLVAAAGGALHNMRKRLKSPPSSKSTEAHSSESRSGSKGKTKSKKKRRTDHHE